MSTRKSVRDLRTLSSQSDSAAVPYRAYMQVTALEMEKARHEAERRSCEVRLESIARRLRSIEEEKAALVRSLVGRKSLLLPADPGSHPPAADEPAGSGRKASRIRFRS